MPRISSTVLMTEPSLTVGLMPRTAHCSAQIPDHVINLTPSPDDFLEDQIRITIKGALHGKDLADSVTIEVEVINKVYAMEESLRRRLISLKLREVGVHADALALRNQE